LKIKRAVQAPVAIFTTINEKMPDAKVDIDVNDPNALLSNFFSSFSSQP
jgi:hypothetical protein